MRADRREPHHHEMPFSNGFTQLMAVVKANDPCAVPVRPIGRVQSIQVPMRRTEIQKQRHLGGRKMPLADGCAQDARTREVAVDICAEPRISFPLYDLPSSERR